MDFFKKFNKLNLKDKDGKRKFISLACTVFGIFLIVTGTSVAYLMGQYVGGENTITAGTLVLYLPTESNGISLNGAVPKTDALGLNQTEKYTFTLKNNGTIDMKYTISLKNTCTTTDTVTINGTSVTPDVCVPNDYIKVGIKEGNGSYIVKSLAQEENLLVGVLKAGEQTSIEVKLWLDESTPNDYQGIVNGVERNVIFYGNVSLKGEQITGYNLKTLILGEGNSNVLSNTPTLNKEYSAAGDSIGLYASTDTDSGNSTYYFRGNVKNNYVYFAKYLWRIVRINEDGSIRLVLQNGINGGKKYIFVDSSALVDITKAYFSENDTYNTVSEWYDSKISSYDAFVTDSSYCEAFRVSLYATKLGDASGVAFSKYTPTFKCSSDGNGYGTLNSKFGLLSYDEVIYAGGYVNKKSDYYLNSVESWLISSGGYLQIQVPRYHQFELEKNRKFTTSFVDGSYALSPVISIKGDVLASGNGTSSNPYVVLTR